MLDGIYQSLMCFFLPYLLFSPSTFNTSSGHTVSDYKQFGVYIANAVVIVVNLYILLNTYRWDWFMLLISSISILLIFLWTGIYTSFTSAFTFYGAAKHCYGSLSFWCITFLIIIVCLLPRFAIKSIQKVYFPRDVDIVREQIRMGKFDYLKDVDPDRAGLVDPEKGMDSASSSDLGKQHGKQQLYHHGDEDSRPIYPPSVTNTVHNEPPYSPKSSDGTMGYAAAAAARSSFDRAYPMVDGTNHAPAGPLASQTQSTLVGTGSERNVYGNPKRQSLVQSPLPSPSAVPPRLVKMDSRTSLRSDGSDRVRPSFDRLRQSLELSRTRSCYEDLSDDFTSASHLRQVESRASPSVNSGAHATSYFEGGRLSSERPRHGAPGMLEGRSSGETPRHGAPGTPLGSPEPRRLSHLRNESREI